MYFAIDFGGTYIRTNWTDSLDRVDVSNNTIKISNTADYKRDSDQILNIIRSKSETVDGISIAQPGYFNNDKFVLEGSNNLSHWIDKPFFKNLPTEFGCKVVVEKDSVAGGIGEAVNGKVAFDRFLYITWGTGVGGSLVSSKSDKSYVVSPLDWENTFRTIELSCGGGHAIKNFGNKFEDLNDAQWQKVVTTMVPQIFAICEKLKIRNVIMSGGITSKQPKVVDQISYELRSKDIDLQRSQLGDYSAIYGCYELLRSDQGKRRGQTGSIINDE